MKTLFCLCFSLWAFATIHTQNIRVSGVIRDAQSRETLPSCHIHTNTGVIVSDAQGYFSVRIPQGSSLRITYSGYTASELICEQDTVVDIFLKAGIDLSPVVVKAMPLRPAQQISISMDEMRLIPVIGTKPDVLKTAQFFPGIQAQNEGTSTLVVRGGSPGENLYLLDKTPLIYVNHLGGFLSVFNPEMISDMTLYKGGFPAKYGSKLSSIVDITQRSGDRSQFKGNLDIGITDLAFSIEGPAINKNASYIISGRKTLIDPYFLLASSFQGYQLAYGFYDLNAKFSWDVKPKHQLSMNIYQGDDYLVYGSKRKTADHTNAMLTRQVWGNTLVALNWDYRPNSRMKGHSAVSYTRYRLNDMQRLRSIGTTTEEQSYQFLSTVQSFAARSDWDLYWSQNARLNFGVNLGYSSYLPHRFAQNGTNLSINALSHSFDNALYAENRATLWNRVETLLGFRMTHYQNQDYYKLHIEPRLELGFHITNSMMIRANYMRVSQNAHLVFTPGSLMNNEIWVPATEHIPASFADHLALTWNMSYKGLDFEVGGYYKRQHNLASIPDGYSFLAGDVDWERKVEGGGDGWAYGVELLVRKTAGRFTGTFSYAYARSFRQFQTINDNKPFAYEYDRPHTVALSAAFRLNDRWTFGAAWTLQSGLPFTPAIGRKMVYNPEFNEMREVTIYGERNSERMKVYHRLDILARYSYISKRGNRSAWTFSIYNVYCRRNPMYYFYANYSPEGAFGPSHPVIDGYSPLRLYQISFFPMIPSFTYSVYFDQENTQRRREAKRLKQMASPEAAF